MEETDRHDAVVWSNLTPEEVDTLASRGIDREDYKNWTYDQRQEFFDRRDK
jgi:hypothetical protein